MRTCTKNFKGEMNQNLEDVEPWNKMTTSKLKNLDFSPTCQGIPPSSRRMAKSMYVPISCVGTVPNHLSTLSARGATAGFCRANGKVNHWKLFLKNFLAKMNFEQKIIFVRIFFKRKWTKSIFWRLSMWNFSKLFWLEI